MDKLSFADRVAVVTGAGGGIGRAHALALSSRGARVVVNDRGATLDGSPLPTSPAQAVVDEINAAGGSAILSTESVSDPAGVSRIVEQAIDTWGRLDVIVNNAGIFHYAGVEGVSLDRFQSMLDVHLLGPFLLTRQAWPHFVRQGYGRVVNTCSSAALFGLPEGSHYSAAKAGIIGLTRSLAMEGAAHGIQVNAIAPGASTRSSQDALDGPFLEWFSTYFTPESVAAVATWLAHSDCPDNGQIYAAQGGRVAKVVLSEGPGYFSRSLSPEELRDHHDRVGAEDGATVIRTMEEELGLTIGQLAASGAPTPPPMGGFQLTQDPEPSVG